MLQGLSHFCGIRNRPGLRRIRYAPIHLIDIANAQQVINSQGEWISTIPFSSGTWLEANIKPIDDTWQENLIKSSQGEVYEQSISGIITGLKGSYSREIAQMARMRFVVLLTDKNNQDWLIGSLKQGLDFTSASDTGSSTGRNAVQISFQGLQSYPALIYNPS